MSAAPALSGKAIDPVEMARRRSAGDWTGPLRLRAAELSGFPNLPPQASESWRKVDLSGLELESLLSSLDQATEGPAISAAPDVNVFSSTDDRCTPPLRARVEEVLQARLGCRHSHLFEKLAVALGPATVVHADTPSSRAAVTISRKGTGQVPLVGHAVIVAEGGAELTVVEEHHGTPAEAFQLWSTVTDFYVGPGSRVNYILLRHLDNREYAFHDARITLQRDARAHVSVVHRGAFVAKSFVTGVLAASGAEFRAVGIGTGQGREFHDMEMTAEHLAEHTESSLLYKTIQGDRSHSVFNGNLHIEPGLKHVRSHQVNNNVLLGKRARAESMPNLIVRAEDVTAEHGATVGELDRDALFFIMSRGLPEGEARRLLIEGFIEEVVREIPLAERHEEILLAVREAVSL